MKLIFLPINHRIIEYFPFLDCEDKTFELFKNEFDEKYKIIKDELAFFNGINYKEHINFRYPLNVSFFIKDDIKDKTMIHIGCRNQELDVGFIQYCKNLIGIEIENVNLRNDLQKKNYQLIINNYENVIQKINAERYYFWTGYENDIIVLNNLVNKYKKKGIFYMGVPQQDDKLCSFLQLLKNWHDKNKQAKIDYVPILFDESYIPITKSTVFTEDNKSKQWNNWKTFNDMKGILLLMKIVI